MNTTTDTSNNSGESKVKITLQNVTSYRQASSLETDKKVNLIYGLNGSGKTTIADYLQSIDDENFKECSVEGLNLNNHNILVYNETFIEETFYENAIQKGIFTVTKENKEALENIDNAEKQKTTFTEKRENLETTRGRIQDKLEQNEIDAAEEIWGISDQHIGREKILDVAGFFDRLRGNKKNLFEHLLQIPLVPQKTKSVEEIKNEVQELREGDSSREWTKQVKEESFLSIENDEIYKISIVGNKDSAVSAFINRLKNYDWVRDGLKHVDLEQSKQCPFCQKDTLTKEFIKDIEDCFNEPSYKKDIKHIESLKNNYENLKKHFILIDYKKEFYTKEQKSQVTLLFNQVVSNMNSNIEKINHKINHPSENVELTSSKDFIVALNQFIIGEINVGVTQYKEDQKNKNDLILQLKKEFWEKMRQEYASNINIYQKNKYDLTEQIKQKNIDLSSVRTGIKEQDDIIEKNRIKVTRIQDTIDKINNRLLDFGIDYFKIVPHDKFTYKLKRKDGDDDHVFISLSEGEKTVISFLYFVEMCIGFKDKDDTKGKIVVIDDPISSLSHIHIFNIATLIKDIFIKDEFNKFAKCFILTHSLYFFNEIKPRFEKELKKVNLFRVVRGDSSTIINMKSSEIKNEYQSYWSIIKEETPKVAVANSMRNIIEYFFGFIEGKNELKDIFKKDEFNNNKFKSFRRYIDRESHSDSSNLYDYKDMDIKVFKEAFKQLFVSADHKAHYDAMMDPPSE